MSEPRCPRCLRHTGAAVLCAECQADDASSAAPLSEIDRTILATIGGRVGMHIDGTSSWAPSVARPAAWIASRARLDPGQTTARLLDLAERRLVVPVDVHDDGRVWRLTPAGCEALGTAPLTEEPAPSLPAADAPLDDTDRRIEYAAALYGITYPPGPLRTAAVVGAMLSRGLDAAACSALAVEQMGEALEERGREAARLALRGEDPSAELLAARLDADRLRAGLRAARRAMVREVRELRHPDAGKREYDSAHRLELAREAIDAVLLPAGSLAGEG